MWPSVRLLVGPGRDHLPSLGHGLCLWGSPGIPRRAIMHPCWARTHPCCARMHPCWIRTHPCWAIIHPCWAIIHPYWAIIRPCWAIIYPWDPLTRILASLGIPYPYPWDPWHLIVFPGQPSSEPQVGGRRQGALALRIRRGCEAAYAAVQEATEGIRSLPVKLHSHLPLQGTCKVFAISQFIDYCLGPQAP